MRDDAILPISELGQRYLRGELKPHTLREGFAPSRREDVPRWDAIPAERRAAWADAGRQAVQRGEVAMAVLAAGASTRMDLAKLPPAVLSLLRDAGKEALPSSKALVPVTQSEGEVLTYLDLFLINARRLLEAVQGRGPVVIFVSEANRDEIVGHLERVGGRGIPPSQQIIVTQPLAPQIVATEQDARRDQKNFTEVDFEQVLEISRRFAGHDLSVGKPAGHGEFLHQLVASGTLGRLLQQGVRYLSVRNIDNCAALLDQVWLAALGRLITEDGHMLVEVSQRPTGQKGGALIRRDQAWRLAEDPSFRGTSHRASDSYFINNAVAILRADYFFPIYETSSEELLAAEKMEPAARRQYLEEIAERGRAKFPTIVEAKPVTLPDGRVAAAVLPETNMWESTGVDDTLRLIPFAVDSDQDAGDDLLELSEEEQQRRASRVRFSPTKNWADYEDPRKRRIALAAAQRAVRGDLLADPGV